MTLIILAFFMTVSLSVFTILKIEDEKRSLHEARFSERPNARFAD